MKISDLNITDLTDKGVDCVIYDPITFENTDITITVFGVGSRAFKNGKREAAKAKVLSKSESEDYIIHYIAASMIKSWENVEDDEGEIEFSINNAINLFETCPFIYRQLESFIEDNSNFFLRK